MEQTLEIPTAQKRLNGDASAKHKTTVVTFCDYWNP